MIMVMLEIPANRNVALSPWSMFFTTRVAGVLTANDAHMCLAG